MESVCNAPAALGVTLLFEPRHDPATHYLYDRSGRLTDVWQPAAEDADPASPTFGQAVRPHYHYTSDARGNQLTQMDANGRVTSFAYDLHGRRISRTLPLDSDGNLANDTEQWTYDARGRVLTHTDFKGQNTRYVYDDTAAAGGRLTSELRFAAGVNPLTGTSAEQTDYGYDALGRRNLVLEGMDGVDADTTLSGAEIARQTTYGFHDITGNIDAHRHAVDEWGHRQVGDR